MVMEWPDTAGKERIVLEDTQCPEFHVFRVVVFAKGKMPAAIKAPFTISPSI
jgi:hypothetical protein